MKPKCGNCKWHEHFTGVCCNNCEHIADFTDADFVCRHYEADEEAIKDEIVVHIARR